MDDIRIKEDERIDDLQLKGLKIIQNTKAFCYGVDSVLLSDFAKNIKDGSKVLDLGAGNGILGLLLCGKADLKNIVGIEIQDDVCEMANRSVELNNLQDKFKMINGDIKNIEKLIEKETFDVVVSNPPYKRTNSGVINESKTKLIARHEILCNLEDVIKATFFALKEKGTLYIIHRPERVVDLLETMRKYRIEPKNIRFIQPKQSKKPTMVMVKGTKYGNCFVEVEKPLIVYNEDGTYTDEINQIYGIRKKESI